LFQVREGRRNGQVELITGMTKLIVEIDRLFVEYPKMKKYFVEGAPPPERETNELLREHPKWWPDLQE
jgi:hypothetical protein